MSTAGSQGIEARRATHGLVTLIAVITYTLMCSATTQAQTFTTLHIFTGLDGEAPYMGLTQGTDGNFYGTTGEGGVDHYGTAFKISRAGTFDLIYNFGGDTFLPGYYQYTSPLVGYQGNFYGIAQGGADGDGTIFALTPGGVLSTVFSFCCHANNIEGPTPDYLIGASNGDFVGATSSGGSHHRGSVFRLAPNGHLLASYSFCLQSDCADGEQPTALIEAANGDVYGIALYGGIYSSGTLFKISNGVRSTVYNFCSQQNCADGQSPVSLIQAGDGDIYGTTYGGGTEGVGTVFKLTSTGTFSTVSSFVGPVAENRLSVVADDGNFYGYSLRGGANGEGSILKLTSTGALTTLYSFCKSPGVEINHCYSGGSPIGLIQGTDGSFYGTTFQGGQSIGVVFKLSVGLGPFVETQTGIGAVGAPVTILGTNLEGTTIVAFNGTPASFTVNATGTAIMTHVPMGATTGTIRVTTPAAVLSSNKPYTVKSARE